MLSLFKYKWDSNDWCKSISLSTYKTTHEHSVAVSQANNIRPHIVYNVILHSLNRPSLYEMLNCGQINKGQVDVFVKCLKVVLV